MQGRTARRHLLAPEVIQTSAMDCGPASLKCLLEGFGIPVSYGRLREACQTDVDGTSIDTLEEVAKQLGLEAEQVMVPADHLLLAESAALPALLVVTLPSGFTHFVVVWRRHGPWVQVMDPGSGRRWLTGTRLLRDAYGHELRVCASDWLEWATSEEFRAPLRRRLADLGLPGSPAALLEAAAGAADWRALATLDAATRLVASLVRARGLQRGREALRVLKTLLKRAGENPAGAGSVIPRLYWSVYPAPPAPDQPASAAEETVLLRGVVLIRVRGLLRRHTAAVPADAPPPPPGLSPELAAALTEPPARPGRELLRFLRGDPAFSWGVLGAALTLAAGSVIVEALILRSVIEIGRDLGLVTQRLEAAGGFLVLLAALLLLELAAASALLRLGRRLEVRLRLALLEKLPRLVDRYFRSRPVSDMAERGHSLHQLRQLPRLGGQFLRAVLTLVATSAALAWLYPPGAPLAVLGGGLALVFPLAFKPHLQERDLRVRTHSGALGRFYLDALLGLAAVRAHSAERAVRREHESLLVEWTDASLRLLRSVVVLEGLQALTGFSLAAMLLLSYAAGPGDPAGALLLAYWALHLPILGEEITRLVRQYPTHRNLALRLLEPLSVPEETPQPGIQAVSPGQAVAEGSESQPDSWRGVAVAFESVTVHAAGHTLLQDIDLLIEPGSHVAIVGASGAGKSSLVGLLLGWHRPAAGRVLLDGSPLDGARLERLRRVTVWLDPTVQLWNRSLLANLTYGNGHHARLPIAQVVEEAGLYGVLERLPEGLQTPLGEGGGLISGGEGQRVRLARGMLRPPPRLVILDEPCRGLERPQRQALLDRLRQQWHEATLLCITHDVRETLRFERVLVLAEGRVVEDGAPAALAETPSSPYRALLQAEEAVQNQLWSSPLWRHLQLTGGRLSTRRERGHP